jgi:predicted nucleic-acid-binding protein
MRIADANFVLRYLLQDVPDQYLVAKQALEQTRTHVPFEVLAETVYVLLKVYKVPVGQIAETLTGLLSYPSISTTDEEVARAALEVFAETGIDFVDAILAGYASVHAHEVLTFDRKLKRRIDGQ